MKHAIALLCAATLLAGCSTVGDVFKKTGQILMDPSIQVGTAEEQPTQIALSLYASADVNPNPVSRPTAAPVEDVEPLPLDVEDDGPFAVSLRSANKGELVEHLRALLGHLENDQTGSPSALAVQQRSAIPGLVVDEQAPPLTLGKTLPETLFTSTATSRGPFPANSRDERSPSQSTTTGTRPCTNWTSGNTAAARAWPRPQTLAPRRLPPPRLPSG
ncbi:hypothetical protein ACSERU_21405 [Pseudomonas aeruginosa]